jgi:20S proteasome alpha/beta subunit
LFFTVVVLSKALALENGGYTSVTALDKYGNSVQIQHARAAASKHGRLVVAAVSSEDGMIVVVSVHQKKQGIVQDENSKRMAHRLLGLGSSSFMVCTGVKADSSWLVRAIRDYAKRVWDRFDVDEISQERYSLAISQALLEFMGYDRDQEQHDGVGKVVGSSGDQDRRSSWARPLGVQVILATPSATALTVLEPSGIPFQTPAFAMGKGSESVNEALQKRYDSKLTVESLKEMLLEIVREVVFDKDEASELVVEILSEGGSDIYCFPLILQKDS